MKTKSVYYLVFSLFLCSWVKAQEPEHATALTDAEAYAFSDTTRLYTVRAIVIEGNRRTKDFVILRELTFHTNKKYTLSSLTRKFTESRRFLTNTGLFHNVIIALAGMKGTDATVRVVVKERWLFQPMPYLKVVDENKMDVHRVNYGLKLSSRSITGRNDRLKLYFMAGFNHQVALQYENLYLDKNLKWTASFGASYSKTHTLNYATANNHWLEYKDNQKYVRSYFNPSITISYRPAFKTVHKFIVGYHSESIADTIAKLNPYYAGGKKSFHYPELGYKLIYTDVDFLPYPLKGETGEITLTRKGFKSPFNLWQLWAKASFNRPISDKYFVSLRTVGVLKLPFNQPYIMHSLWDKMNFQGFDDYIMDGVAGGYTKIIFSRQLVQKVVHIPSEKVKQLNNIPLRVYGKVFGNMGYFYHPDAKNNRLNNQLLYAGGFGIDIIGLTDIVVKLEWTFNQLGGNNLSLRDGTFY
ncbi:MAG: hypothetical protein ICV79_14190 [Flavisolibacter sp.]|nr:hypothetical protein [Flavisolibacter sp.]